MSRVDIFLHRKFWVLSITTISRPPSRTWHSQRRGLSECSASIFPAGDLGKSGDWNPFNARLSFIQDQWDTCLRTCSRGSSRCSPHYHCHLASIQTSSSCLVQGAGISFINDAIYLPARTLQYLFADTQFRSPPAPSAKGTRTYICSTPIRENFKRQPLVFYPVSVGVRDSYLFSPSPLISFGDITPRHDRIPGGNHARHDHGYKILSGRMMAILRVERLYWG